MDKSAIQEIIKLAINAGALLSENNATLIPDGYKLQSLNHLQLKPDHFKGSFSTTVLREFVGYILENHDETTRVYINHETMAATAIIDQGSQQEPLWGRHRAKIWLLKTPGYKSLLDSSNNALKQQDFIDFAEDWQSSIHFYYANVDGSGHEPPFKSTINSLRKLKINASASNEQAIGNFSSAQSALESIEIKAGSDDIPTGFLFSATPYEGFDPITFDCQLRALNNGKELFLKYRITALDSINEQIANQFRDKLIGALTKETAIPVYIGVMDYQ